MRDDDVLIGEEDTVALDVLGCAARCLQRSKLSMSKFGSPYGRMLVRRNKWQCRDARWEQER